MTMLPNCWVVARYQRIQIVYQTHVFGKLLAMRLGLTMYMAHIVEMESYEKEAIGIGDRWVDSNV